MNDKHLNSDAKGHDSRFKNPKAVSAQYPSPIERNEASGSCQSAAKDGFSITKGKQEMKKKRKRLTTISLGYRDDVYVTICLGHVDAKTFSKAFKAEGWDPAALEQDEILYEYWIKAKSSRCSWKKSVPGKKGAVPVTVSHW